QEGHEGTTLQRTDTPDNTVTQPVTHCGNCKKSLKNSLLLGYKSAQSYDIPKIEIIVTEFLMETKGCSCGHITTAENPPDVTGAVCYGTNIKSLTVLLMQEHHLPLERASDFIFEITGHRISEGSFVNWTNTCAANLEKFDADVVEHIKNAEVVHADETGIFGKLKWIHVKTTEYVCRYFAHKNRGGKAVLEEGILAFFKGILVHDALPLYYSFLLMLHALCNAHILRELIFFHEEKKMKWAGAMKRLLLKIKESVDIAKLKGKTKLPEKLIAKYRKRYEAILRGPLQNYKVIPQIKGKRGRKKQEPYKNLLDRLLDRADDVLRFMSDFRIPFDNNISERALRMIKVKMKVSGCFRSEKGAKSFCLIKTYLATARKNRCNLFQAIKDSFTKEVRLSAILV
ncbi:MAG: IS66 family transposase, partial [Patescibacteria group bacterium]